MAAELSVVPDTLKEVNDSIMQMKWFILVMILISAVCYAEGPLHIVYWRHHYQQEYLAMKELIRLFEKQYPTIKIDFMTFPASVYSTKIVATLTAGEGPDIINIHNSWAYGYIRSGLIVPVSTQQFAYQKMDQNFFPLAGSFKWHGIYYGVPIGGANLALFYNKKLFREAGLTSPPHSWEELLEMAKKLTRRQGNRLLQSGASLGMSAGQGWNYFVEGVLRQAGIKKILSDDQQTVMWDNAQGVEALRWYTNFVTEYKINSLLFPADFDAFRLGLSAMMVNGNWTIGNIKKVAPDLEYGTVELPYRQDLKIQASYGTFWANCVTRKASRKVQKAAWKFIHFITTYQSMKYWSNQVGELPMRRDVLKDKVFLQNNPLLSPFIRQMQYSYSSVKKDEREYKAAITEAIEQILYNGMSPKQALHMAAKRINTMLKRK